MGGDIVMVICWTLDSNDAPATTTTTTTTEPEPQGCQYDTEYSDTYYMGYAAGASKCNPEGCDSFEEAKEHCDELETCVGITFNRFGQWTVRGGCRDVSPYGATSWPKSDCTSPGISAKGDNYNAEYPDTKFVGFAEGATKCNPNGCTFEQDKAYCDTLSTCVGVTLDPEGRYTVRGGRRAESPMGCTSWMKSTCQNSEKDVGTIDCSWFKKKS